MHGTEAPSRWVRRWAELVRPQATVLDVACGGGRHSRLFAARGCSVDAVDRDATLAAQLADQPRVRFLAADLESQPWPYPGRRFDVVVVTNYLHRPLWPALRACLAEHALLIYETFAAGNAAFGKPSNPDYLLQPGELLNACAGLHVLAYEDGVVNFPKPARVQRVCARSTAGSDLQALRLVDVEGAPAGGM